MNSLRILHAADLHLDSPFEGLPEGKAARRRAELRLLLGKIADTAQSESVQLVLLPGDLLDSDSAFTETAEELLRTLEKIKVPVIIAPGNHDFYSGESVYAKINFPENVYIFKENAISCIELPQLNTRVWGAAFTDKYSRPLLDNFRVTKKEDTLDLLCVHGEIASDGRYNPISEAALAESGINYAALGHIHTGSGLRRAGYTYYAWPGCPEGRGFDELGKKEIYIVDIDGTDCRIKPICAATRKYEILTVELNGKEAIQAIDEAIGADTENDIYRIILTGETEEPCNVTALTAALEGKFFSLQIKDKTRLHRDIWEKAGEDSLRGQFLQKLKAAYDSADDDGEKDKIVQAVRWGLAALDRREEVVLHDY